MTKTNQTENDKGRIFFVRTTALLEQARGFAPPLKKSSQPGNTTTKTTARACGLQPEVHLGLRRVRHAVAAEVHLLVLHQHVPQRVAERVILIPEKGGRREGGGNKTGRGEGPKCVKDARAS